MFVSLLFFARSCCLFACSSTFLWLDSTFFLILFGCFDFVRTFAAKNDGTITCRLERVQASVVTAFFFLLYKLHVINNFSVCHFAFELYFYTVPRCFVNGEITWMMTSFFSIYSYCLGNPFLEVHGCFNNIRK